ncbi:MAG: hypothetical protein E7138_01245 [Rikenellaceae bacterium]|nr:hypothetical protein [Rikenellaceae bacterium]
MGWFSPYKRHANSFNYTPRYYDPAKEAREQRRAELRGERLDDDSEYTPGKYIRAKREARDLKRAQVAKKGGAEKTMKMWTMVVALMLLAALIYILVPRLGAIFEMATTDSATNKKFEQQQQEVEEFDPYAPLIIVPNDYEEGDEIEIVE